MWTSQVVAVPAARQSGAAALAVMLTAKQASANVRHLSRASLRAAAGEPWFIRRIIDKYHDAAAAKGVRVVPCCGYDSIPSDLGTWFVVDHVKKQLGK